MVASTDITTREGILRTLRQVEGDLRAQGVAHAAIFGSIARGEQHPGSDIDIMIEIDPESKMDLFQYVGIVQYIEELFPVPVDVANRAGLKERVRPSAERDAVYAF